VQATLERRFPAGGHHAFRRAHRRDQVAAHRRRRFDRAVGGRHGGAQCIRAESGIA